MHQWRNPDRFRVAPDPNEYLAHLSGAPVAITLAGSGTACMHLLRGLSFHGKHPVEEKKTYS
jgi:hypothetical protein